MNHPAGAEIIEFSLKPNGHISVTQMPHPHFERPWINRAFQAVLQKVPDITFALLRERALGHLRNHPVQLLHPADIDAESAKSKLRHWLARHRRYRLLYLILEGLILPLTPIMALLPGPNIFFYIPALLFYFHLASYRGLRSIYLDQIFEKISCLAI